MLVHYNTIFYTEKNSIKFIRMIFISFNSDIFNSIPSILLQDQMYFTFEDALHVYCVKCALRIRVAPDVNVSSHYRPAFATCKQFIRIFRLFEFTVKSFAMIHLLEIFVFGSLSSKNRSKYINNAIIQTVCVSISVCVCVNANSLVARKFYNACTFMFRSV